ncbi:RNA polymerase factor sigma-54 [uncultured Roseovarius sp.]|uniref:RNA polymerase factor sigma-54 n=1 Tax=uncultured Roseovarius sp. TaxID=293344 RepID=UPI0026071C6A|nr:RNA polymerase factor sigma-54 [uncultured Roseovarius sp.]
MGFRLTPAARQTGVLNQSMVQAFNVMRMDKVELIEHLANAIEENPFLEADRPALDLPVNRSAHSAGYTPEDISSRPNGLYRHIADQLPLILEQEHEYRIAQAFLLELEPSGWLGLSLEEIARKFGFSVTEGLPVLKRLQTIDPAGLFAQDLKDCLRLQALDRDQLDDVMEILISHLDELLHCDVATLANRLKINPADVAQRLFQIRRMNPKPGSCFEYDETLLRQSDVILRVEDKDLVVELTNSSFPTVRLARAMDTGGQRSSDRQKHLNELIRHAKSLKSSLEYRNSTTSAVVAAIFARQRDFLIHGYAALRPMSMAEIALDVGISDATVSRVLTGLTVQCPQGNIAARSLFCEPVSYCKQPTTRHTAFEMIKQLIATEDKLSPLKDQEIAGELQKLGLAISRRTVAKYRNHLGVSSPVVRRKNAELMALSGWSQTPNSTTTTEKQDNAC